ncbi:MAG: hypothetical protein IPH12_18305 [Saprospirales bacterium]|nr:hypothetical protein [Saprospirales bacterium]
MRRNLFRLSSQPFVLILKIPAAIAGEGYVIDQAFAGQGGQRIAHRTFTCPKETLYGKKIAVWRVTKQKISKHPACYRGEPGAFEKKRPFVPLSSECALSGHPHPLS